MTSSREHRHHERRHVGRLQVVFGRADQRDAQRAEGVADSAVRCGTAVICTMPSGTPMIEPSTRAIAIHL